MANPQLPREPKFRLRLAGVLLACFALQSLVRLALLAPVYGMGRFSPLVHGLVLAIFGLGTGAVLMACRGRKIRQFMLAGVLAGVWLVLTAFDVSALASRGLWSKPVQLDWLAQLYCEGNSWPHCLTRYPALASAIVAAWIAMTALVAVCADGLAVHAKTLADWLQRHIWGRLKLRTSHVFGALSASYCALWLVWPSFVTGREPVIHLLGFVDFIQAPVELLYGVRPNYHVERSPSAHPLTIVVIVVDSLRADHVELGNEGPSNTPFLRSLAQSGQLHDLGPAVSTCTWSYCGIISVQSSGTWASFQQGMPLMLSDVLAANGYQSHFLLGGPHATVGQMRTIYGPNISTFLDDGSPDSGHFSDDRDQMRRLPGLRIADPGKSYLYIHLMSAHAAGQRYANGGRRLTQSELGQILQFDYDRYYQEGVAQADDVIRQLFAELRRKRLLENAVVLITADHGERLGHPGSERHGDVPDHATTSIPMLLFVSRPANFAATGIVSQADAAPTLLDMAGIAIPHSWQGRSLLRPGERVSVPVDSTGVAGMVAMVDGRRLLFLCNTKTGAISVHPHGGPDLTAQDSARALARATALYAPLLRRRDGAKCFRPAS